MMNSIDAQPIFEFLKAQAPIEEYNGLKAKAAKTLFKAISKSVEKDSGIKWNFTKFLISKDGETIKRYAPTTVYTAAPLITQAYTPMLTERGKAMEELAYTIIPAAMGKELKGCHFSLHDYAKFASELDTIIDTLVDSHAVLHYERRSDRASRRRSSLSGTGKAGYADYVTIGRHE